MPDEVQRLLHYIAEHYTGLEEAKEVERSAAADATGEIRAGQRRVMQRERALAHRLARPFERGLRRAFAAYRAGGDAISLDDRDPEENRMAEALVHFLVGPGLARSLTRETEPMHYTYIITVNWEKLAMLAREAKVDLDAVLESSA